MGNVRCNCKSCKDLVKKYGKNKLEICEYCDHYYHIKKGIACSCGASGRYTNGTTI